MRLQYAIVFVSDMTAATAFYRDVLGIPLRFGTPEWTEFATEGATLALHRTEAPTAAAPPGSEPAGGVRIGFNVADLDAFHARMLEHDVPCVQEPRTQFGTKLAQYSDPDGQVFSVGEAHKGSTVDGG